MNTAADAPKQRPMSQHHNTFLQSNYHKPLDHIELKALSGQAQGLLGSFLQCLVNNLAIIWAINLESPKSQHLTQ